MTDLDFQYLHDRLAILRHAHSFRQLQPRRIEGAYLIDVSGRRLVHFGSNDYLGFSSDSSNEPKLALNSGAGASALVAGYTSWHDQLCQELAAWESTEAAVLFPSGYAACSGTVATLADPGDLLLSDELNHASLIDGCRLSKAQRIVYRHRDVEQVEQCLIQSRSQYERCWIVTESVFGMDGDVAPLDQLSDLAQRYDAHLIVDEAHGTGVLGPDRSGGCSHFDLKTKVPIRIGTLSKALGSHGGFVVGPRVVIDYLINRCRSLIFSTAGSPLTISAALEAVTTVRHDDSRTKQVQQLAQRLRDQLHRNFPNRVPPTQVPTVPIVPLVIGDNATTVKLSQQLYEAGFFVPAIRPPTVPDGTARLRISVTAAHTSEQIDLLCDTLITLYRPQI